MPADASPNPKPLIEDLLVPECHRPRDSSTLHNLLEQSLSETRLKGPVSPRPLRATTIVRHQDSDDLVVVTQRASAGGTRCAGWAVVATVGGASRFDQQKQDLSWMPASARNVVSWMLELPTGRQFRW